MRNNLRVVICFKSILFRLHSLRQLLGQSEINNVNVVTPTRPSIKLAIDIIIELVMIQAVMLYINGWDRASVCSEMKKDDFSCSLFGKTQ